MYMKRIYTYSYAFDQKIQKIKVPGEGGGAPSQFNRVVKI